MKKLVLYGASHAFALKTIDAINRREPTWDVIGFLDDNEELHGTDHYGHTVLGDRALIGELKDASDVHFFNNVMGHWERIRQVAELLLQHECRIASLIDPSVHLFQSRIGRGAFIAALSNLSIEVNVGDFVSVHSGATVGHHVTIGDYVLIGQGSAISSYSTIKTGAFIGAGAVTTIGRTIGARSIVGAGSVVAKDVPDDTRVLGYAAVER